MTIWHAPARSAKRAAAQRPQDPIIIDLWVTRRRKRISQAELAIQLGVCPNTLQNYERGVTSPGLDFLKKWYQALHPARTAPSAPEPQPLAPHVIPRKQHRASKKSLPMWR